MLRGPRVQRLEQRLDLLKREAARQEAEARVRERQRAEQALALGNRALAAVLDRRASLSVLPVSASRSAHKAVVDVESQARMAIRRQQAEEALARGAKLVGGKPINSQYAGREFEFPASSPLRERFPQSVIFNAEGFPDFRPYAIREVRLPYLGIGRWQDFKLANELSGLLFTPPGFTWHHVQDGTTMQLIPRELHAAVRHTGGIARGQQSGREWMLTNYLLYSISRAE